MSAVGQAYGYILCRTTVPLDTQGTLELESQHDYARIYVNGRPVGVLDRRLRKSRIDIKAQKGDRLNILVENIGRVNFTKAICGERVGFLGGVLLDGAPLHH